MIVVFPFSMVDQDLALKNAQWMTELGGCHGHELLVCHDPRCTPELVEQIRLELTKSFDKLYKCTASAEIDGWPEGANYFFRITAAWLQGDPDRWPYFFWMEPDAVMLKPGALTKIETEYKHCGRAFMGDRVQVGDIPLHMSGIGVYENPIYLKAGEAYRAFDTAWDMAAKDQIVPNAYFTRLIEHAWKHPKFTSIDELRTQIRPEAVVFHSSKDGSLIDILRGSLAPEFAKAPERTESSMAQALVGATGLSGREVGAPGQVIGDAGSSPVQATQPVYDIVIRTYPGDYEWLDHCIHSIYRFCHGFRKIWIVSPAEPPAFIGQIKEEGAPIEWKVMNDETEDGYLAQQITKLYADVITDYQPDYILHVDSDVIFNRAVGPGDFFMDGKLIWFYTPYEDIQTPWQPIITKFMGFHQPFEFMRRLPIMIPRWLYPRLREFCHNQHGVPISDYIKMQPMRAFSEFNAIGAYAYFHYRDKFDWFDTTYAAMPEPFARQFHSWSGLTPEVKTEIEKILGGGGKAGFSETPVITPPVPIKELPSGVWVLKDDQISQWVEQEGRLDHDQNLLPDILKHIRPGDTVVDAGAFIGDHTLAYSDAVGPTGVVHAFEPNPVAYACLFHNMEKCPNVILHDVGLSDVTGSVPLSGNNGNYGGVYIGEHMKIADVPVQPLDIQGFTADFIKIDVEGYEVNVLRGAEKLINACRPKMVIEINTEALLRQNRVPSEIYRWLVTHDYGFDIMQENCSWNDPLFDILCLPKQPPEKIKADSLAHTPESSPVANLSTAEAVNLLVKQLKDIADESPQKKAVVAQKLVYAGLRPTNKKIRNDNKAKPFKWKRQRAPKKQET